MLVLGGWKKREDQGIDSLGDCLDGRLLIQEGPLTFRVFLRMME